MLKLFSILKSFSTLLLSFQYTKNSINIHNTNTMKLYTRQTYLNTIRPFFGGQLIKVLVGARRVGKTVLLSQIAELLRTDQPDAVIVSINLELYEFSHIRQSNDLYQFVSAQKQSGKALCVLIDEVQEVNGLTTKLIL